LRISRDYFNPDTSNHSLYLIKLFILMQAILREISVKTSFKCGRNNKTTKIPFFLKHFNMSIIEIVFKSKSFQFSLMNSFFNRFAQFDKRFENIFGVELNCKIKRSCSVDSWINLFFGFNNCWTDLGDKIIERTFNWACCIKSCCHCSARLMSHNDQKWSM